ncbi:hypothetical protein BZA05DRAFT_381645 [Tricharina praecox]|uniref:uncharacterized protein n=1 Tax=Tricharina praecox TaxID=43433 RepID=UPI00222037C5|nr:uncharacterized protein BZA05DRAFT_381645 [Tricharina praecox]KAI5858561.1 hypothetical protein BZA05DRAFT_381645 [Tricharina praecox]
MRWIMDWIGLLGLFGLFVGSWVRVVGWWGRDLSLCCVCLQLTFYLDGWLGGWMDGLLTLLLCFYFTLPTRLFLSFYLCKRCGVALLFFVIRYFMVEGDCYDFLDRNDG